LEAAETHRPWIYLENIIPEDVHQRLLAFFLRETESLPQKEMPMYGKKVPEPRLTQLYKVNGGTYRYSGLLHTSKPFDIPELRELVALALVQLAAYDVHLPADKQYNTALVNHYRGNQPNDGVSKHDDKDGRAFPILSFSLGAQRLFRIYARHPDRCVEEFVIQPRSLLIMLPSMQDLFKHEVVKIKDTPKKLYRHVVDTEAKSPRINVTLRVQ
jgi:alkylated DNA repair dioxygenase AlkB